MMRLNKMIRWIQTHISVKLFLSYFFVILVYAAFLIFSVNLVIPSFFSRHMQLMGTGMSGMMQNLTQGTMIGDLFASVRVVLFQSLFFGLIVAFIFALLTSVFFSRSMIAPVQEMIRASERIAEGRFNERVQVAGDPDELDQLAIRFNQMAEKLEQTENMRSRLIGDISHELRTPLSAIKGTMEALEDGVLPGDEATYWQIQQEAARLERLVDDLQELSRVEAGAYSLQPVSLDLTDLVEKAVERTKPDFVSKDIDLNFQNPQLQVKVYADEDRTFQVLMNLLANARQYTSSGGKIEVSIRQQDTMVVVSVRDTGVGIPPEHLEHIFTRFYRVDPSRSRAHGGSGIGLTIAKHLVEAQSGEIRAESEGAGKGSTFSFTLPVAAN
jgi:two-component system sensor histidine kinase BaeS